MMIRPNFWHCLFVVVLASAGLLSGVRAQQERLSSEARAQFRAQQEWSSSEARAQPLPGVLPRFGSAVIRQYSVEIDLERDSTLTVKESITVDFGSEQRHGIKRHIPIDYERGGFRYSVRLRLLNVTDENNNRYQCKVSRWGQNIEFKIGDPNRLISGQHVYNITYRVQRAVNYFPGYDELYWNVTGNEWEWAIQSCVAVVNLPKGVDASNVRTTAYTGYYGSKERQASIQRQDGKITFTTGALVSGQGLTIVVGLPKGTLHPPNPLISLAWFVMDNALWLLIMLMPLVTFCFMLYHYLKHGRDPEAGAPIVVQYEPPKGLTPAEVGTLVDERVDVTDIVSTVIDLAVRGYLRIQELHTTKFLFFQSKDYEFVRLKDFEGDNNLVQHERKFLKALFSFAKGDEAKVKLSELKDRFYIHLGDIRKALYNQLLKKKLFPTSPERVRRTYIGVGVAAIFVPLMVIACLAETGAAKFLALINMDTSMVVLTYLGSAVLTGVIIMLFARCMPRKTQKGARLAQQALGFKEFVERVEKDRIERLAKDDPTVFERLLPYAMVLGVADEWAEKFRDLAMQPPSWYESPTYVPGGFRPVVFVHDLGSGMNTMASAMTSAPSRRGGGGGRGFSGFGGGGFSGGGFGGGGGGGW